MLSAETILRPSGETESKAPDRYKNENAESRREEVVRMETCGEMGL